MIRYERVNVGGDFMATTFLQKLQEALAKVPKEFVGRAWVEFETTMEGGVGEVWLEYSRPATEQEKIDDQNQVRHYKLKVYEDLKKELGL